MTNRLSGWNNCQRQTCKACGVADKFDFNVPQDVWCAVVPHHLQSYVVCLGCFDDFARDKGVNYATSLRTIYFAGDQAVLRLDVMSIT
ncbi:MAG: hypothetical protein RO009_20210 [Pseudorhodoplanes sp.]|jgi:hypothetical protein|nr:hypothetical protein [Pseudorhodoplanes sp.]